jgi:hypothetical protein
MEKITYSMQDMEIRNIEESPINAQVMSDKDFTRLVKNIKKDGNLTSSVLLMRQQNKEKLMCISGHHRIKAAKKAGLHKIPSLIIDEVGESTRIRLQITHNDIHGTPDESILSIMQQSLNEIDIELIAENELQNNLIDDYQLENIEQFQYISICLKPKSYDELMQLIGSHSVEAEHKMIIEASEYDDMKDALTIAFKNGFKTPGKAFRKFLDIVLEHRNELEK